MSQVPKAANDNYPIGSPLPYKIAPRDISPAKAARILGQTLTQFQAVRFRLQARGFPLPDLDTGNYDSKAIDVWQDARSGLNPSGEALNAADVVNARLAAHG